MGGFIFKRAIFFLALLVAAPIPAWAGKRLDWPHEKSEIAPDPSIEWGALENGFRYALMSRDTKPGVISMRLVVEVGSLDEADDERGIAHFIEHMAFEGTRNFAAGELVAFFQRLGMSYGVDVNAFTYHDKTVYHLELPQNEASLVRQGLTLFRDYADGIVFSEDRIENEREVILREKQARESPSSKIATESFRFSFEGTRLADRHPIGLESVIRTVPREQLIEFYEKWYRPSLMTLVVVGDFEGESLKGDIEKAFSSLEEPRGRLPKRKLGKLSRTKPYRTGNLDVQGVERYTLEISRSWNETTKGDTWELRKKDAVRTFATALFNERCRVLIDGMSDNFANYNRVYGMPYCQLTISSGGEYLWDAYIWMDQLLRQALFYGFSDSEIEYMRKSWLQASKASAALHESAEPRALIDDLVDSIVSDYVYVDAEEYREIMDALVKSLDAEMLSDAFSEVWNLKKLSYFLAGDLNDAISSNELKRRLKDDRRYVVLPYLPPASGDFQYTDLGEPGEIVEQGTIEEVGASTYRFSNNARLTFLHTENEKETVRALVRVGSGMLAFRDSNPGTHALAMPTLFRSGFGDHEIEDVFKELRSNVTSFIFGVEDHDAFTYRLLAPEEGLDEFLKIVAEYLLSPRIDDEAFDIAQSKLRQSRELEPDGMNEGYRDLYRMLYPDEPRFHSPSIQDITSVDPAKLREWMETPFKEGYLEVTIVGDADEQSVVEMFANTLGALPERRELKEDYESIRGLKIGAVKGRRLIEYENGKGDSAASVVVWTIQDPLDFRESAALYVLSSVFESRVRERVREEMGATYSPSVRYVTFPAYDTLRHIRVDIDCIEKDASSILDAVLEIGQDLAANPIDHEELKAAVAPMEEGLKQAWSDNGYLIENVLYGVQEYPSVVENAISYREGLLTSITPEEILDVAKRYLEPEEALAVAIVPAVAPHLAESPDWEQDLRAGAAK